MINSDIFEIIMKYLIRCSECNKYNQKSDIDHCDRCHWGLNYQLKKKKYFCLECSKLYLNNDIYHDFWVSLCIRCLMEETQSIF